MSELSKSKMNLYLISRDINKEYDAYDNAYDTYDSAVVAAWSEEDAVKIHPSNTSIEDAKGDYDYDEFELILFTEGLAEPFKAVDVCKMDFHTLITTWCPLERVKVELIGTAKPGIKRGVICASFNAG